MKAVGWIGLVGLCWSLGAHAQMGIVDSEEEEPVQEEPVQEGPPAKVPPSHQVRDGDTLWDITGRYFGDPYQWPLVWSFNPDITNPHWIYPDSTVLLRGDGEGPVASLEPTAGPRRPMRERPPEGTVYLREYGFLDRDALKQTGYIIAANEEHMLLSNSDIIYARFDDDVTPEIGASYTIYRDIQKAERDKDEQGHLVRIMGTVVLQDYDKQRDLGHALIVETLEPIERGYKIAPMARSFHTVPPKPADRNLRARVIASLYPRKLLGPEQLVYLNVGSEDGVQEGNHFVIIRRGDEWRRSVVGKLGRETQTTVKPPKEPKDYPFEVVADGLAVSVRPNTTALLIRTTVRAVIIGDKAEMRQGQ